MFDDPTTSEIWPVSLAPCAVSYEHVLGEAGEQEMSALTLNMCRKLRADRGPSYYRDLLFVLTHQRFPKDKAYDVWIRILCHREQLTAYLGRNPGIAVAALDYLSNIEGNFRRPTLIDDFKLSRLVNSATRDALTGLYDREALRLSLKASLKVMHPVSVIMLDLDKFKEYNDTHGHLAGDDVLCRMGELLLESIRPADVAARYGGEEFCLVLDDTTLPRACAMAERLRGLIEAHFWDLGITASFGVASYPEHEREPHSLLFAADQALYAAKRSGRNRVSCAASQDASDDASGPARRETGRPVSQ